MRISQFLTWTLCVLLFARSTTAFAQEHEDAVLERQPYVNGFAILFKSSGYFFINKEGKYLNSIPFQEARDFSNHRAAVHDGKNWGFIDEYGKLIIGYRYDIAFDFKDDKSIVSKSNHWQEIDVNGNVLQEIDGDDFLKKQREHYADPIAEKASKAGQNNPGTASRSLLTPCPENINFENGNFTNWECFIGSTACVGTTTVNTLSPSVPTAQRHTILSATTPTLTDQYGLFPINPPDASNFCVKLGNTQTGRGAERIRYTINVPASATGYSITYQYAVVFQDPNHPPCHQPRFTANLYDAVTGQSLACGSREFIASAAIPGFQQSTVNSQVKFKPWSSVFISLAAYAGRTLYLEFTTADCTDGGHWGYAYLDVNANCNLTASMSYACEAPHSTTFTAPPGFATYLWWDQAFSSVLGNGVTLTMNPGPPLGTTLWVEVFPYAGFGCRDTLPVTVTATYPTAVFDPPARQCLTGNNFSFHSSSTIVMGSIVQEVWDFGDGNSGTGHTVTHSYTAPGTYNVKLLVVSEAGCKDSLIRQVTVVRTVSSFTIPQGQCFTSNNFNFTSTSTVNDGTITNYEWSFGDGNTGSGNPVTHSYPSAGTYNVKLIVTSDLGCRDSITQQVTVHPHPLAAFATPASQCKTNNDFLFSSSSTIASGSVNSFVWDFGDGNSSNVNPVIHSYTGEGTYNVKLIVGSNNGCLDSITHTVIVNPQPSADFPAPQSQCVNGNNFVFTSSAAVSSGSIANCTWDFGDGNSGSGLTVNHSYSLPGTYSIKMVAFTSSGCKDSVTKTITVFAPPLASFNLPVSQCASNNSYSFNSTSTINGGTIISEVWDFGDGGSGTGTAVNHHYNTSGIYTVKLVVSGGGTCKDSTTRQITVHPQPIVDFLAPASQCLQGNNFSFSNGSSVPGGSISATSWDFGDGNVATGNNVSHSFTAAGTFNIKLKIISNQGCEDSISKTVTVHPQPTGSLAVPSLPYICENQPVTLIATGGTTYQWYYNTQLIPNSTASTHVASQPGNYTVTVFSAAGCSAIANGAVSLSMMKRPKPDFIQALVCEGKPLGFTNRSDTTQTGPLTWQWNFGDGSNSNLWQPVHLYGSGGVYRVNFTITPANCPSLVTVVSKEVTVEKTKPNIRYNSLNVLSKKDLLLEPRRFGNEYLWKPNMGLNNYTVFSPVFNYDKQVEYVVRITTAAGCQTFDTLLVRIFKNSDIQVPKAFTPNNDGHNDKLDIFLIGIKELRFFRVFNRWGQLMYETKDALQRWDGKYLNKDQPLETYVWIAEGVADNGEIIVRRGQTILIR